MEKMKQNNKDNNNITEEDQNIEETPKPKKETKIKYFTEVDEPPLIIMIQGGHLSGKTTLIKSLVKYYTNQNITSFKGSITVRNSKNQRLTFIECPNDISSLDDCSKIVDVAILLIDASQGIQAQTLSTLYQAIDQGLDIIPVLNKIDLPAANPERVSKEIENVIGLSKEEIICVSWKTGENVELVLDAIIERFLSPEEFKAKNPKKFTVAN